MFSGKGTLQFAYALGLLIPRARPAPLSRPNVFLGTLLHGIAGFATDWIGMDLLFGVFVFLPDSGFEFGITQMIRRWDACLGCILTD